MESELIFAIVVFILGLSSVIFAKPLGIKQYNFDLRWKILLRFGINFRVWFFKITGILMICIAVFVVMIWFFR